MKKLSVEKVFKDKAPKLSKYIPRPVIVYLRRTIHEDELNFILENFDTGEPFEFLRKIFDYIGVTFSISGLDKLDKSARYTFASNHPFGGMDGMMLAECIGSWYGDVRVVVNDILMHLEPLRGIFVPVNKHGRQKSDYARAFSDIFTSDTPVLTFPAGLCSRRVNGRVSDLAWRPNFVKRSVSGGRLIVPIYVEGELSDFFYRLSTTRKKLGIKANIEMLYLPDEMFSQRGKHFNMVVGEPIEPSSLASFGDYYAQAQEVRKRAYALADKHVQRI